MAIDGTKSEDPKNSVASSNTTDTMCGEVTMGIIKDGNGKEVGSDESTISNEDIDKEVENNNEEDTGSVNTASTDKTEQENGDGSGNGTFKFKLFAKFPVDIQRHIIHQYIDSLEPQVVEVEITADEIEFEEEDDYLYGNEFMDTKILALTDVPEILQVSSDVRRWALEKYQTVFRGWQATSTEEEEPEGRIIYVNPQKDTLVVRLPILPFENDNELYQEICSLFQEEPGVIAEITPWNKSKEFGVKDAMIGMAYVLHWDNVVEGGNDGPGVLVVKRHEEGDEMEDFASRLLGRDWRMADLEEDDEQRFSSYTADRYPARSTPNKKQVCEFRPLVKWEHLWETYN